jgi:predicted O-methyltransferase YrrM
MMAELGLQCPPSPKLVDNCGYPGRYGLIFQKAVAAWWWGKPDETRQLHRELLDKHRHELDEAHHAAVQRNIESCAARPLSPAKSYASGCNSKTLSEVLKGIYGFCSVRKATILRDLILTHKMQVVVEIGVLEGSSFIPQAMAIKHNGYGRIYAVDPWSQSESLQNTKDAHHRHYWGTVDHTLFYNNFLAHVKAYALTDFVTIYKTTSKDAAQYFPPYSIDLLHIDGNHSEEKSYEDVQLYLPLVRKGGFIIFDDLHWSDGGVVTTQKAVGYLRQHCADVKQVSDDAGNLFGVFQKH